MIKVGQTTFRDTVCDGNVLFRVHSKTGDAYKCVVELDEPDYGGTVRYYSASQINAHIDRNQLYKLLDSRRANFWDNRTVGEVLHYHNASGKYMRGVVIRDADGKYKLKPTGLVGPWSAHELPKRRPNGNIDYGYYVTKIREEDAWAPSDSCIFESPSFSRPMGPANSFDPRTAPLVDHSVRGMSPDEEREARLERAIDEVRDVLENRYRTSAPVREVLTSIKNIVVGIKFRD